MHIIHAEHLKDITKPGVFNARFYGGLCEARTHDIMVVTHALSQLS